MDEDADALFEARQALTPIIERNARSPDVLAEICADLRNAACGPEEQAGSSGGLGDFDVADLRSNLGLGAVIGDAALWL